MILTGTLWQKYLWLLFPFFGLNTDSQWCQGWTTGANRRSSCLYWTVREGTGNLWQLHEGVVEDPCLTPHTWNHIEGWHWEPTSTREQKDSEWSHHSNIFTSSEPQFRPGRPRGPSSTQDLASISSFITPKWEPMVWRKMESITWRPGAFEPRDESARLQVVGEKESREDAQSWSPSARAPDQRCQVPLHSLTGLLGLGGQGPRLLALVPWTPTLMAVYPVLRWEQPIWETS